MWNPWELRWHRISDEENEAFPLGHEAFWNVLADEDTPSELKSEAEAALYLLRHFEKLYQPGIVADRFTKNRLKSLVQAVPDPTARKLLGDTLMCLWLNNEAIVPEPIVKYGLSLQKRGYWHLAQAVWDSVISAWNRIDTPYNRDFIEARINRAYSSRRLGSYGDALRDYIIAQYCAANAGFFELALQAMIGGSCAVADGGSPQLGLLLARDAMRIAKNLDEKRLEAWARQTSGYIFQRAGKSDLALLEFSIAYEIAAADHNQEEIDLALANIAACAAEQGYWELASDTNELLVRTSQSNRACTVSLCNLLELHTWQGNEPKFRQTYEQMRKLPMDADVEAHMHLYYARGVAAFATTPGVIPLTPNIQVITEYSDAAAAINKLGVTSLYQELCDELATILKGRPSIVATPAEYPLPDILRPLHKLLLERISESAA